MTTIDSGALSSVLAASDAATASQAAAAAAAGRSGTTNGQQTLGQDAFLKLLVAQLKYQDPTDPVKGAEFIAQTAQFSSVEKLEEMSRLSTELVLSQRLNQASNLVGRTVSYTGTDGTERSGVVSAAQLNAAGPVLKVGTDDVPLASVTTVRETSPTSSTPTS
jgi:flagellar basal-body rod modification protein FlgD